MNLNPKSKLPATNPPSAVKWEVWMGMNAWYIVGDQGPDSWLQITPTDYLQPLGKPRISDAVKMAGEATVADLMITHRFRSCAGPEIRKMFDAHLAKIKRLQHPISA